eukprot:8220656-Pyramimonas_sp.AAC.2
MTYWDRGEDIGSHNLGQRVAAAADWNGDEFEEGSRHAQQAGAYLCNSEYPYRAFVYSIIGCGRNAHQ